MVGEIPATEFGFTTTGDLSDLWGADGKFSLKPTEAAPQRDRKSVV